MHSSYFQHPCFLNQYKGLSILLNRNDAEMF